jgi:hypothetical protein
MAVSVLGREVVLIHAWVMAPVKDIHLGAKSASRTMLLTGHVWLFPSAPEPLPPTLIG